jgi:hypothetical protein
VTRADRRCLLQQLVFSESHHFSWDNFPANTMAYDTLLPLLSPLPPLYRCCCNCHHHCHHRCCHCCRWCCHRCHLSRHHHHHCRCHCRHCCCQSSPPPPLFLLLPLLVDCCLSLPLSLQQVPLPLPLPWPCVASAQHKPMHQRPDLDASQAKQAKQRKLSQATQAEQSVIIQPKPLANAIHVRRRHRPDIPTAATTTLAIATTTATARWQLLQQGVMAEATRAAMAAVRATALMMMAATVGGMVTAMATVHLVSTAASAALATWQQCL